jgi:glutathione peroxidase
MQQLSLLKMFGLVCCVFYFSSFYTIHYTTIEGNERVMQNFEGKKILLVVLPSTGTANDSVFLKKVDSVSSIYKDRLSVIAIPSFDDGYDGSRKQQLQLFYRSLLNNTITITEGMYTHKTSGNRQHALFKWLTHKEENMHFDIDVKGSGQKFFVSENGELYGVFGPEVNLSAKLLNRMLP